MIIGLRRSALYVPCDSERMLAKATAVPADVLLLNLEDGVAESKKAVARANLVNALKAGKLGPHEIVVRINAPATAAGRADLAAVVPCGPDGVCLPKVESAAGIHGAATEILRLETGHGLPPGQIRLHAMIESAAGVLAAREIASASPRMASLVFGSADYCADVRCLPGEDRTELLLALQIIVAAARAAGIEAIDSPCFDLRNSDLLRKEASQARRLGFDGKSALHPGQLAVINGAFDVTPEQMSWALKVVAELKAAEDKGRALSTLEGRLIDNPHRSEAERVLQRARLAKHHPESP
jgi:citrate lyase subunit beta/citryl-CoA lyase